MCLIGSINLHRNKGNTTALVIYGNEIVIPTARSSFAVTHSDAKAARSRPEHHRDGIIAPSRSQPCNPARSDCAQISWDAGKYSPSHNPSTAVQVRGLPLHIVQYPICPRRRPICLSSSLSNPIGPTQTARYQNRAARDFKL